MTANNRSQDGLGDIEGHFRTIGIAVGTIVLGYVTWTVKDMPAALARVEVRIEVQGSEIRNLREQIKSQSENLYTKTDAQRELDAVHRRIDALELRVQALKKIESGK